LEFDIGSARPKEEAPGFIYRMKPNQCVFILKNTIFLIEAIRINGPEKLFLGIECFSQENSVFARM